MIALVLSDIHGDTRALKAANRAIREKHPDVVLLLGDITNMGEAEQARETMGMLAPARILGFAGNWEMPSAQEEIEKQGISLHAKKEKIGEHTFVGFGGGLYENPGRFLHSEEEIGKTLGGLMKGEKKCVLLTHLPPLGTKIDLAKNGAHIGSAAVRMAIEKNKPLLHLCGHCHEAAGEEKIGGTLSINVGAAKDGKALLLRFNGGLEWEKAEL